MTNPVALALRRTAVDLAELDQPWALIGGLAVSVRAEPRTTRDVDVMVAISSDPDAERLIVQLQQRGYRVMAILEQKAAPLRSDLCDHPHWKTQALRPIRVPLTRRRGRCTRSAPQAL